MSRFLLRLLVIVCFAMVGAVLAEASSPAQNGGPQSPEGCATCHVDIVAAWQDGSHAQAYADSVFQEKWQASGSQESCLVCHTTGFDAITGDYAHEGVACEACHGETPVDHPPAVVTIDPGVETCAGCHTTTFTEWKESAHGDQQLACTTCHNPHPQTLRFDNSTALCLNCHNEAGRDDYVHLTHAEQQCVDCHWHHTTEEDALAHYASGNLFPTGHTSNVETVACVTCHEANSETEVVAEGELAQAELGLQSEHPLLEAQVRIEELEAELDTVDAQGANTSSLRLVQGLVIGAAVGGVFMFGASTLRRRNQAPIVEKREEE